MANYNNEFIIEEINGKFAAQVLNIYQAYDVLTFEVTPDAIPEIFSFLFNHKDLKFTFLTDLCGIHTPQQQGKELGVVYHLHSWENNIRLRFKCFVSSVEPNVPSVSGIFASANWQERETYDFYGINFTGHPNLTRILNVDEMEYFPMRKEYPLEDQHRTDKDDRYFGR